MAEADAMCTSAAVLMPADALLERRELRHG